MVEDVGFMIASSPYEAIDARANSEGSESGFVWMRESTSVLRHEIVQHAAVAVDIRFAIRRGHPQSK